jgi:GNAT superfamily N-acetyltransferase
MSMVVTHKLQQGGRAAFASHLFGLGAADRRMRFGRAMGDAALQSYAAAIDLERDALFGVYDDELALAGAAHLARGEHYAEVGVSVLDAHRRQGLGSALLERCRLHARNWGLPELFLHTLSGNVPMLGLARKFGMRIVIEHGEADAYVALPPPDASSYAAELLAERVARLDRAFNLQSRMARSLVSAFRPHAWPLSRARP